MSDTPKPKEVGWCDALRFMSPYGSSQDSTGEMRDHDWWISHYTELFNELEDKYDPDGLMLLENHMMDSIKYGRRYVLPFGGKSTRQEVPDHPFSVDESASGTVCVEGVYYVKKPTQQDNE